MDNPPGPDSRLQQLEDWLVVALGEAPQRLAPASADASFRRYFRAWSGSDTFIAMDAPPALEDLEPFLRVAALLARQRVHVPRVLARDLHRGFLLLSDLGSRHMLEALNSGGDPDALYADALAMLLRLQVTPLAAAADLPRYDATQLRRELELFPEWFIARHLGVELTATERGTLLQSFEWLEAVAAAQPVVLVHRDYHSRNLMVCPADNPGVLDFQDAVVGPLTYDLVSLLKDCYVRWPRARLLGWLDQYREQASAAGLAVAADRDAFIRDFDLMGLQRHLKVLGIFARLWYRDGKPGYLQDLPRVLDYVLEVTARYPELSGLDRLLHARLVPAFEPAQARALAAA